MSKDLVTQNLNTGEYTSDGRPNNQSGLKILHKIKKRLERNEKSEKLEPTEIQETFKKEMSKVKAKPQLAKKHIDIAHNVSIKAITETIIEDLNHPDNADPAAAHRFVDEVLSTDDEQGRKDFDNLYQKIVENSPKKEEKKKILDAANKVLRHLNRASRNLMPGNSSSNRSIGGDHRDPHVMIKDNEYQETATSKRISLAADDFLKKPHFPKEETGEDGESLYQSSSIDSKSEVSWYNDKGLSLYKEARKFIGLKDKKGFLSFRKLNSVLDEIEKEDPIRHKALFNKIESEVEKSGDEADSENSTESINRSLSRLKA